MAEALDPDPDTDPDTDKAVYRGEEPWCGDRREEA
jgi:hypothetical protein